MQAFHKLSSSFVLMQNEYRISFYHTKACQPEATAILHRDPTRTLAHALTTGSNYIPKAREFAMGTPPYILFLSFIYIKNVYSHREGHFGGVLSVW